MNPCLWELLCLHPGCSLRGQAEPTEEQDYVQGLYCGCFWNIFCSAHKQKNIYWLSPVVLIFFPSNQSLISWDSDILASVFLTRRAVSLDAGLWAQHSVMSFPICLRHCGKGKGKLGVTLGKHSYYLKDQYLISDLVWGFQSLSTFFKDTFKTL